MKPAINIVRSSGNTHMWNPGKLVQNPEPRQAYILVATVESCESEDLNFTVQHNYLVIICTMWDSKSHFIWKLLIAFGIISGQHFSFGFGYIKTST